MHASMNDEHIAIVEEYKGGKITVIKMVDNHQEGSFDGRMRREIFHSTKKYLVNLILSSGLQGETC